MARIAKHMVLIIGGKGGVGKSMIAAAMATLASRRGLRVGLADTDTWAPVQHRLLGARGRPRACDGHMVPVVANGVKLLSIGLLTKSDTSVIWRGPLLRGGLQQLVRDAVWGPLDLLLLDTPPGTGETLDLLAEMLVVDAAIIVTSNDPLATGAATRVRRFCATYRFGRLLPISNRIDSSSEVDDVSFVVPHLGTSFRATAMSALDNWPFEHAIGALLDEIITQQVAT